MKIKYVKSFYHYLGVNLIYTVVLSIFVSFFDSIGIGFFIGLAQFVFTTDTAGFNADNNAIFKALTSLGVESSSVRQVLFIGIIAFTIKSILYYLQQILNAKNTANLVHKQRQALVNSLEYLSYPAFIKHDFGHIQNVSTTEITRFNYAVFSFLNGVQYLIMAFVYLCISFLLNYQISIIILFVTLLFYISYSPLKKYLSHLSGQFTQANNSYNSLLFQILNNFKYIKSTFAFPFFSKRINTHISNAEKANYNTLRASAITETMREPILLILLCIILAIYYSINHTISIFALFSLALFYRTLNYIILTQNNFQRFNSYEASLDNILNLLDDFNVNKEPPFSGKPFSFTNKISLENISLSMNSSSILKGISIEIPKNMTIGVVGISGAGKTSLVNVISGLIPPSSGKILFDDLDSSEIDLSDLRRHIGYVSQDPVVFNDSLYNNVTLWSEKNQENKIRFDKIIQTTYLEELLSNYSNNEDTLLGEKGIILSGGQKQRVAIARELFKSPDIIIMDEATSSLDTLTENQIRENLDELQGSYTLIIIAHRLNTIRNADIIYVLENGMVVASGNYDRLIKESSAFQKLIQQQRDY